MTTPKTASPELVESQADKEETVNEAVRRVEAGASHYLVVDKDLTAPPGSCADGACYIVAATATGDWAGHEGEIAIAVGTNASNGWYFRIPEEGVLAWVQDETPPLHYWDNSSSPGSWQDYANGIVASVALDDLTDVDAPFPSDGQVLTFDTDSPQGWKAMTPAVVVTTLDGLSDVDTAGVSDGYVLTYDADSPAGWRASAPSNAAITATCGITIDGGGSAITTGIKGDLHIPVACTITVATMLADQSGSAVVDIWKDTYANFPPTDADSITAAAPPTISAATKSQDSTLTGWTTSCSAGDILRFNVDSCATITRLQLQLTVTI